MTQQNMREQDQSLQLTIATQQPTNLYSQQKNRPRHIYLQQQNIYGRFVPYLLLKDQLQSQIDSSGTTALHHMCSYNSPYIPLFLSSIQKGDPILNRKSKLGHTPLDVAGLYCSKQYIQLLKQKGAIDNGNVDFWAIQGGNPTNWSGKIYPDKKALIHWAAYNDLPQVIAEYAKQGVSVSQPDSNGLTPIDLTILNKSYNSLRVLTDLGERPKQQLLKKTDSLSIKQHFQALDQSPKIKVFKNISKISSILLFLAMCLFIDDTQFTMALIAVVLFTMIHILVKPYKVQKFLNNNRSTQFISELFLGKKINRRNHFSYLFFHLMVKFTGLNSIINSQVDNHLIGVLILIIGGFVLSYSAHLFVQIYGICRNLTYDQIFYSHRWPHLWNKIKYVKQRKFIIRQYSNPEDRGIRQNLKEYLFQ